MKTSLITLVALPCVLAASIAFAQAPSKPTQTPVKAAQAQTAKDLQHQKTQQLHKSGLKSAMRAKTGMYMKALQVKGNKLGVAKTAHSVKLQKYGTHPATQNTKGVKPTAKTKSTGTQKAKQPECKNGICPMSHDPAAGK